MGLFSKKCEVCGTRLPDNRRYKGVCNPCGDTYKMLKGQIEDTLAVIERAKNAVTCYDRCLFGMGLITEFRRFVDAGFCKYPGGRSFDEWASYLAEKANAFALVIREQNEKRKFDKKVGIPHFGNWKRLYKLSSAEPGACKGCWANPAVNDAGFCLTCLVVGTGANQDDMDAFLSSGGGSGLSGEDLTIALLKWKLEKSKGGIAAL